MANERRGEAAASVLIRERRTEMATALCALLKHNMLPLNRMLLTLTLLPARLLLHILLTTVTYRCVPIQNVVLPPSWVLRELLCTLPRTVAIKPRSALVKGTA